MNEEYRRLFTDIDELVNFLSSLPIRSDIYFSFNKVLYAIDCIGKDKDVVIIKTKKEKESVNTYSKEDIIEELIQYIENDYDIQVVVEGDYYCIQNVVNSIKKVGSENRCIIEIA